MTKEPHELDEVVKRYARRDDGDRYSMLKPDVWQTVQERQSAMLGLFRRIGWSELQTKRLIEVGSGSGGNLLELLRLGFSPHHLLGVELLGERHADARRKLPQEVLLLCCDASQLELADASQDVVLVSTVFSSLLDENFQMKLAECMWRWLKPGGGVLWYDFTVDNPRNPDVRGVSLARIRELFPHGKLRYRRLTLAPPIARAVTKVHPALYTLFNAVPMLRTHVLAWVEKPLNAD